MKIALTPGEPAGIGPDIVIKVAQRSNLSANIVVFADKNMLMERAKFLGLPLSIQAYDKDVASVQHISGQLIVHHCPVTCAVVPGKLDARNSSYVVETIALATQACFKGDLDALVTAPIHKGIINEAGIIFSGHTEYLAAQMNVPEVVMLLVAEKLRVALLTTHLPLAQVPAAVTPAKIENILHILHEGLRKQFKISHPKILVCGLNPHAGEGGHLGREELDVIIPTLIKLQSQGLNIQGPLPADTIFTPHHLVNADAVLAMYHDQGLPVLKYCGFGKAVNITLGLPIIRTSVDHGTALDKAGTGEADEGSLLEAIKMAVELAE